MTEDTLEQIIKKTLEYAERQCTIAWQGGEPTLIGLPFFQRAMELIEKYNYKKIAVHHAIQTNGYHMEENWATFFAQNHFLVGLSLDGNKSTHNAFRVTPTGDGTFFDILATKELFDRFHVDYNILTVVNSHTALKAGKIYDFYKKNNMKYLQFIPCLDPFISEEPSDCKKTWDFSLSADAYGHFLMELFDRWYDDALKGTQPYIRSFENYIGILAGYQPEACEQTGICGIQHVVEADGSVYPCDFYVLDEYRLGNFNTDDFATFEDKRKELRFQEISMEQALTCKPCPYFPICRGGCKRHRVPGTSDSKFEKNRFCTSYQMFFAHSLDRMQKLASAIPKAPHGK